MCLKKKTYDRTYVIGFHFIRKDRYDQNIQTTIGKSSLNMYERLYTAIELRLHTVTK